MTSQFLNTVCPHDCPSACALEVECIDPATIGAVRAATDNSYTAGVICAKVSCYAERVHHPDRLKQPLRRVGAKGDGRFEALSWDDALDEVAEAFSRVADGHGPEAVWPYFYAGTMGLVQRDSLIGFQRAGGYSAMTKTICSSISKNAWLAGAGALRGTDGREMAESDLVIMWGTNAVSTQIQAMNLALRAKKERGAKLVTVDPYRTKTAARSDLHLALRPGTDGALACAVMHVLFKEGFADRKYLAKYTDCPDRLESHLESRDPAWAAAITGLDEAEITEFARLYGKTRKSFIRIGYGFSRSRNGASNLHAVSCLPAVTGAWKHRGGGALLTTGGLFKLDKSLIEGKGTADPKPRSLDMCRIGDILAGDSGALLGGPPVKAMIVQNTNPAVVAPESAKVRKGLAREDLFLCVHEQFPTETAAYADIVLPATTFLEHDDLYVSYGHSFLQVGKRLIEPRAGARCNHDVLAGLAERLGLDQPGLAMSSWQVIDETLKASGYDGADALHVARWLDCQVGFEDAHFLNGFGHPDGKFRFAPDWAALGPDHAGLPPLPDHAELIEVATEEHPFRLVTAPARSFLNSSFTVCPTSRKNEKRPMAQIHPDDCRDLGIEDGDRVRLGNGRGSVVVDARPFDGLQRGVVVVEGIWPNRDFEEGNGINTLVGADAVSPGGGAAFHDTAVWVRPA
ncbi:MAG: molybdopterin oxidoreductase family protein [Rhodospirillales bacterium]|nr:molybdopterin oxidoreductase family protein [Rhodospirillales bacterium]